MRSKFLTLLVINFIFNQVIAQTNEIIANDTNYLSSDDLEYIKNLEKQKEQSANIRFCNMIDKDTNTIGIIYNAKDGPQIISSKFRSYSISSYLMNPPGEQSFHVFRSGDSSKFLSAPISFQVHAGDSYTVIIYSENNTIKSMIVSDDYKAKNKENARFRMFNFISDVKLDIVSSLGSKEVNIVSNNSGELEDLPLEKSFVDVVAKLTDKNQMQWRFPLNFEKTQSVSCFLVRDKYGRIRTKIESDGWRSEGY